MNLRTMTVSIIIVLLLAPFALSADLPEPCDAAKPIEVETGKIFSITLQSNRTTGYAWEIAGPSSDRRVTFISTEYLPDRGGAIGAGGNEIWSFRANAAGKTSITLIYVRPWERGVAPARKAVFAIWITDPAKSNDNPKEE